VEAEETSTTEYFSCDDCLGSHILCGTCMNEAHCYMPFHSVRQWVGEVGKDGCYLRSTLEETGYILFLGHCGDTCLTSLRMAGQSGDPIKSVHKLTVMDTSGICSMNVMYCSCPDARTYSAQLLEEKIFPATDDRPATAFTFRLLDHFHQLNVTAKVSVTEFHNTMVLLTDPVNPDGVPVCILYYTG
jgi:hypothetical protein